MDALILAAGYSRRLEPLTLTCAKPLLPVGGRPMVDYALDQVRTVPGLRRTFVVTNDKFHADFVAWSRHHPHVVIINDGTRDHTHRLGAIGDLALVVRCQQVADDLLVVAGDNLFDASLGGFVAEAQARTPKVSIGIVDLQDPGLIRGRYGVVSLAADGRVMAFEEKPAAPSTTLVSTGIYYLPAPTLPRIADYLAQGGTADNIGHLVQWFVRDPGVHGCLLPGRWYDIGDRASYELADRTFRRGILRKERFELSRA